jgi:hypothetical protein
LHSKSAGNGIEAQLDRQITEDHGERAKEEGGEERTVSKKAPIKSFANRN